MSRIPKDPQATLDYTADWTKWLLPGEVIIDKTVTVTGVTLVTSTHDDKTVTAWVAEGTAGTTADLTFHVTTSAGRQDERTMGLYVADR